MSCFCLLREVVYASNSNQKIVPLESKSILLWKSLGHQHLLRFLLLAQRDQGGHEEAFKDGAY